MLQKKKEKTEETLMANVIIFSGEI